MKHILSVVILRLPENTTETHSGVATARVRKWPVSHRPMQRQQGRPYAGDCRPASLTALEATVGLESWELPH